MLEKLFRNNPLKETEKRQVMTSPETGERMETNGEGWSTLLDLLDIKSDEVTPDTALRYNTVYASINILSDDIGKLKWNCMRKVGDKISRAKEHPVDFLLNVRPNPFQTPFTFKKGLMVDTLTHGNGYALIEYDGEGKPKGLYPLTTGITRPSYDENSGKLVYRTTYKGMDVTLQDYEVLHIRTLGGALEGISPVKAIRLQVEGSYLSDTYNNNMIKSGGVPKGILSVQGSLNKDAKKAVRSEWTRSNSAEAIAIIDGGLEYKSMGVSQHDMQFIEAKKFNQIEISSIFKVPLHKLNQLDHATFSNIEHQSIDYVRNTLQPWLVQIEEESKYKLFSIKELRKGYYTRFNMDSELRGDAESRAKVQEIKLRNGAISINEWREQDEVSPFDIPIASEPLVTLNYTPLSRLEEYQYREIDSPVLTEKQEDKPPNPTDEETEETKGGDEE